MANQATATQATAITRNCITSVATTLYIPPLITYRVVTDRRMVAYTYSLMRVTPPMLKERSQGKMVTANLPMPTKK